MIRALLALAAALTAASPVRADAAPLVPGWDYAKATHRIELAEGDTEHVFVIVRHYVHPKSGDESEFVELRPAQPLELTNTYRDWAELLIVSRSAAQPYPTATELTQAVESGRVSVTGRQRFAPQVTVPAWSGSKATITYRVQRTRSGDGLEIVRTSWQPLWQWYVVAITFSATVVFGGLWIVRRVIRRVRFGSAA